MLAHEENRWRRSLNCDDLLKFIPNGLSMTLHFPLNHAVYFLDSLSPIPKGKGKAVVSKRLTSQEIKKLFENLKNQKKEFGWQVRITLTDWEKIKEGHALLVHPNGDVVASPVWSKEGCIHYVGNILEEGISEIWKKYPYKKNHVKKYVEKSLMVC